MARELDLTKPLSAEDVAWLRTRHTEAYVDRMIALAGTEDAPAPAEPTEDEQEADEADEKADSEPEGEPEAPEAGEGDEDSEEDLIGSAELYDPLAHTTNEVRKHLKEASPEEQARVKAVEEARTDREARTSILNYNPS